MLDVPEALAQALHEEYLRDRLAAGDVQGSSASLAAWDDLPEEFRESSRRTAVDLCEAIRERGYELVAVGPDVVERFDDDELEGLARTLHDRWMDERLSAGWQPGERRDDGERFHPDLVAWADLSAERREIDRNLVRQLPPILREIGLSLVRSPRQSEPSGSIDEVTR